MTVLFELNISEKKLDFDDIRETNIQVDERNLEFDASLKFVGYLFTVILFDRVNFE